MLFLISALLLVWCSLRVGSRLTPLRAERFWIGIATGLLQLGVISVLTSVFRELRPTAWIASQLLIAAIVLLATRGWRSLGFREGAERSARVMRLLPGAVASLSPWSLAMLIVCIGTLGLSAFTQISTPIHAGDDMMYHGSRVIYWIQRRSVFPFVTHNDRQTLLPFGSELLFLWPVMFTNTEVMGRIVFWMAYPCAAIGQYLLLRAMNLDRSIALTGVVILLETPLVAASSVGLKPELWTVTALLGAAYWVVALCVDSEGTTTKCFFLGTFAMLAMNMRGFPVALVPGAILAAVWSQSLTPRGVRLKALAAGLAGGVVLSGLIVPVGFNLTRYGHPLGPLSARRVVTADLSPRQLYTHAVRFALLLAELPDTAIPADARARVETTANLAIATLGAGKPLPLEDNGRLWPGRFTYSLAEQGARFSTWGWLWIPALVIGLFQLARNVVSTWPRVTLAPVPAISLLAVTLLVVVLSVARWMAASEIPARYLIGPYALALPIAVVVFTRYVVGRRLIESLAAIVLVSSIYQPLRLQAYGAVASIVRPVSEAEIDGSFEEPLSAVPDGARILFAGNQDAPDYALFAPSRHYAHAVIPWGKTAFDPRRMRGVIDAEAITHVLVQDDDVLRFQWDPEVSTHDMVAWLGRESGLTEIPLNAPHMRLFATNDRLLDERALHTGALPSSSPPLITIDASLENEVGIDPVFLRTAWPIEHPGAPERGFLWIGEGQQEGIEFALWSRENRGIDLQFSVGAGPSLITEERVVALLADGALVGGERTFRGEATLAFHLVAHTGRTVLRFFALDAATIKRMPNGDTRHLVVGLHHVGVASSRDASAEPPSNDSSGDNSLDRSARRAAAMVASAQHPPGYWLTNYTSGVTYENPSKEMNVFTTAIMIDMLEPAATAAGLQPSVRLARQFLASQIEASGLVRYHGRPDGPTIGVLGCVITPDADDTALVWRIAPTADAALRSAALWTFSQYRTADGLYRTWLAPRDQYQCIDPGADPDPADVVIQMHVLMMLARADPAAAAALCRTLGQAIDQDRVWVYYARAPMLPMLRQTDVQAAGCPVRVPPARVSGAAPGQELWMSAAGLLQRDPGEARRSLWAGDVRDLLRQISKDNFAPLRQFPPLMYHNDLTASVRRFYWSEEFGYALWLRLWFERGAPSRGVGELGSRTHAADR